MDGTKAYICHTGTSGLPVDCHKASGELTGNGGNIQDLILKPKIVYLIHSYGNGQCKKREMV